MYLRIMLCKQWLGYFLLLTVSITDIEASSTRATRTKKQVENELMYQQFINQERQYYDKTSIAERQISGGAALAIGLYGYYFDKRGPISSVVYSLTQTTGVFLLSDAIYDNNHSSLFWALDRKFRKRGELSYSAFKNQYAIYENERRNGLAKKTAYTSLVLAGLYGLNGSNEKVEAVQNAYYFISGNFLLIGLASLKQILWDNTNEIPVSWDIGIDSQSTKLTFRYTF